MSGWRMRLGAMLTTGLLVTACAGGDDNDPVPPIPQNEPEPDEDENTEPGYPFAVPDEIDEEYVQLIVDELLPMVFAADRDAVEQAPQSMPPDDVAAVYRAVYSPRLSTSLLTHLATRIGDEASAEELREEQEDDGDVRWVVTGLGEATSSCVAFEFDYDFSERDTDLTGFGTLLTTDGDRDPDDHNPTPWVLGFNGPPDQWDADLEGACAEAEQDEEEFLAEAEDDPTTDGEEQP